MATGGMKRKLAFFLLFFMIGLGFAVGLYLAGSHFLSGLNLEKGRLVREDINRTFSEYITATTATGAGNLEIATHDTMAFFAETREKNFVWGTIPGGVTSVEIKAPVTYRYHLRLDDPWNIEIRGTVCIVHAPSIRPSLPPAIHTDRMEKRIDESWMRFDGQDVMSELERKITPELNRRARANIPLVREHGRKVVAAFIRNWLLQEKQWRDRFHSVVVVFAGEENQGESLQPLITNPESRDNGA